MANSVGECLADFSKLIYDQTLTDKGSDTDLIMSPFSIGVALSMLYAGCGGSTKEQLKRALFNQYQKDDGQLHANFSEIISAFNADNKSYQLHVANRLYPNVKFVQSLLPEYVESLAKFYRSDLKAVDYANASSACSEINGWAEEKTHGKIKEVLQPSNVSSDTALVIINAIYFKGSWLHPFKPNRTQKSEFFQQPNQSIQLDLMSCGGTTFKYLENEQFQLLGMPYVGEELTMYFFLPRRQCGLEELEKSLKSSDILQAIGSSADKEMDSVVIPKFKTECSLELNDILNHIGMTDMFVKGKADLSNINGGKSLYVSTVIHKAFIEINEEGAEAAAVTAVGIANYCMIVKQKYFNFIANHPFMYLIFHEHSKAILFTGHFYGK